GLPTIAYVVRELDEQNRVFLHDAHEKKQPDHRVEVQGLSEYPEGEERARNGERKRHQHRDRIDEAVELGTEDHVRDDDPEEERHDEGSERFLEGLGGSGGDEAVAVRDVLPSDALGEGKRGRLVLAALDVRVDANRPLTVPSRDLL